MTLTGDVKDLSWRTRKTKAIRGHLSGRVKLGLFCSEFLLLIRYSIRGWRIGRESIMERGGGGTKEC